MSQTSTSHVQWISRAVAAAKAGNQSVAKIQLQKAAEADPDDPAIWLWLGWLADSPASAAQCLELARSDERFRKAAEAGIEFSRALASFDLDDLLTATPDEEPVETIADDAPSRDPVESVEEVAAAVESLQFDDEQEDKQEIDAESTGQEVADPVTEASDAVQRPDNIEADNIEAENIEAENIEAENIEAENIEAAEPEAYSELDESLIDDSVTTEPPVDDERIDEEERIDEPDNPAVATDELQEPAIEHPEADNLTTVDTEVPDESAVENAADTGLDPEDLSSSEASEIAEAIEAELMKAASELWQLDDETTSASADESDTADQADHIQETAEEHVKPESMQMALDTGAESPSVTEPAAEEQLDQGDEAEGDFDFADDDSASSDFEAGEPPALTETASVPEDSETTIADNVTSATHEDPWLDQTPVDASQTPRWRKAQSDWFTADSSSDPNIEQHPHDDVGDESFTVVNESADRSEHADLPDALHDQNDHDNSQHESSTVEPTSPEKQLVDSGTELLPDRIDTFEQHTDALTASAQQEPSRSSTAHATPPPPPLPLAPAATVARVTPSDVWQRAAAEKSGLTDPVKQPSPVVSPADPAVFAADEDLHVPPAATDRGEADPLNRKTVLVVDDSPTVRKLVSITLEKRGYKVVSAFDGVAAIKEIAAHNPSMILMDVNMPRLDGYQLCKLVKKHETTRDIPVLMLTGTDGMFDRLRGRLVGCAGYIAKPFAPEDLVSIVEQHIHQRQGS